MEKFKPRQTLGYSYKKKGVPENPFSYLILPFLQLRKLHRDPQKGTKLENSNVTFDTLRHFSRKKDVCTSNNNASTIANIYEVAHDMQTKFPLVCGQKTVIGKHYSPYSRREIFRLSKVKKLTCLERIAVPLRSKSLLRMLVVLTLFRFWSTL